MATAIKEIKNLEHESSEKRPLKVIEGQFERSIDKGFKSHSTNTKNMANIGLVDNVISINSANP